MQVLIEFIFTISKEFKPLAVFLEDHYVFFVTHMWHLLQDFVGVLLFSINHFIVAFIDEVTEAWDLKNVFWIGLILFVGVSCNPK